AGGRLRSVAVALADRAPLPRPARRVFRPWIGAVAHADVSRESDLVGDLEQRLYVWLGGDEERGERRTEPLRAQAEQDVLGERVDGRAADDALAGQPGVGGEHVVHPHADDEMH